MKIPKPWLRSSNLIWYVQMGGRQINLGRDREKAFRRYHALLAGGDKPDLTVHELIDVYWSWLTTHRKPSTVNGRRSVFKSLRAAIPARLAVSALKPAAVEAWAENGRRSPTTVHTYITLVQGMYNWGIRYGHVDRNPLHRMEKPTPKVRQDFLPPERFVEFLGHAKRNLDLYDLVFVTLDTGARATEMFRFTAKHFDHTGRRFVLSIENSKGERRSRVVFLPVESLAIIVRRAGRFPAGPLFRNGVSKPWDRSQVCHRLKRIRKRMGLPSLCLTMLRHSFAHYRLTQAQDPAIVAKLLGHTSTAMIYSRYGHLDGSAYLQQQADRFPIKTNPT